MKNKKNHVRWKNIFDRKSSGLMEEVQVVGNNMRSLEHSQEMVRFLPGLDARKLLKL